MHPYIYLYIHVYVYTHTSTYNYIQIYNYIFKQHMHMRVYICLCTYIYAYMEIYVCACMRSFMHACECVSARARVYPAAGAGRTVPPRACTGRATRGAPSPSWRRWTCRAPRARAGRTRRVTMGGRGDERGRSHGKETTHCTHTHPHARDRHTDAFGAATVP